MAMLEKTRRMLPAVVLVLGLTALAAVVVSAKGTQRRRLVMASADDVRPTPRVPPLAVPADELRQHMQDDCRQLAEAHRNGDTPGLCQRAHRIRGVALLFGAWDLAADAGRIEDEAARGRLPPQDWLAPINARLARAAGAERAARRLAAGSSPGWYPRQPPSGIQTAPLPR